MTQISRSEKMLVTAYRKLKKRWKYSQLNIGEELENFFDEFEAHFDHHFPMGN